MMACFAVAFGLGMQQVQPDSNHHHERHDAERTITVQPQAKEQAGEDESRCGCVSADRAGDNKAWEQQRADRAENAAPPG